MNLTKEQAATLRETMDYDKWSKPLELDGGFTVRAKIAPDYDSNLEDSGDWYGRLEPVSTRRYDTQPQRPNGMDGAARKLQTRDGAIWWQPPADVVKNPDTLAKLEAVVRGYFREDWSYIGIVVEVTGPPCDCCDARKTYNASLWGIESNAGDYLLEVLADLASEAFTEAKED